MKSISARWNVAVSPDGLGAERARDSGALNKALLYELIVRNVASMVDNPRAAERPADAQFDAMRLLERHMNGSE